LNSAGPFYLADESILKFSIWHPGLIKGGQIMKIGIVGSGKIGGLIGTLWALAGHEVFFSSRHPETLDELVQKAGSNARAGLPDQAIAFGDVILLSIPFAALPEYGRSTTGVLRDKIVLETSNPYPERDGLMAQEALQSNRGTGLFVREWFPGVRVVRAFNTVWDQTLEKEAYREGSRLGIPLASDNAEAMQIAASLVKDAGFEPVIVGTLDRSIDFDFGTPVYDSGMSGVEVRTALSLSAT
jgi:predicted dinucleotide-binding enzyme